MIEYIAKRVLLTIPVLLGLSILVFLMLHLTPGDPVQLLVGDPDQVVDPEVLERARRQLGLDRPLPVQYLDFLSGAIRGDLGMSFRRNLPVTELLAQNFQYTLRLAFAALAVAASVGVSLGVIAALRRGTVHDTIVMVFAAIGVSMPSFWLGLLLVLLFAVKLQWLPAGGTGTWKHLVLPSVTLGLSSAAIIARLTRSMMLEVLQLDYVRTARSKGLPDLAVNIRHALRNALIPVVTVAGLELGALLGGTMVVEVVFARQGIGTLAINGILSKDFNMVQGTILVGAVAFVVMNLIVDMLYAVLQPSIRHA